MSANNTNMTIDELIFDHDDEDYDENNDEDYDENNDEDYDENNEEFPVYLCSRDSAIARDSEGEPIPYRNATNDDLPDMNVFLKRMSLQSLNEQFDSKFALTMEDYLELEKYSYKTQLSLTDSVKYSRFCHCCNKSMGENRFKRVYCCDECEITVEVDDGDCICVKLCNAPCKNKLSCKICSRKGNFIFNLRYGVTLSEIRIQKVREYAKEQRLTITDAIPLYAELNDCGKDCKLCYTF
jgi:hypothetical protein